jgi:hypothetical protein
VGYPAQDANAPGAPGLSDDAIRQLLGLFQPPGGMLGDALSSLFSDGQPFKSNNPGLDQMMLARAQPDPQPRDAPEPLGQSLMGLASAVAPYLVGGAPEGSLSSGMRIPGTASEAAAAEAKFPQYAESYPPVGPPVTKIDPVKGTEYLAKDLTPEALAFQKERERIMTDMAQNPWQPYYDPAQRFPVDPAGYAPFFDTGTIVPAKGATVEKHMATIGSPEARANLQNAYAIGSAMPDTSNWYWLGQLEQDFIKQYGPEAGRKAFQDRLATGMAATTGGANPTSNYLMSAYGNYLRTNDLPYPQTAYEMPFPIGGRYASGNIAMHQKIFDQGGFEALGASNPKRYDFATAFLGNPNAMTMDEQMVSGMTPGIKVPPANTYGLYTGVGREEAAAAGLPPQNFQDVAWAGFKNLKDPEGYTSGKPFIQDVNESIERTRRLTGMSPEEIVRRGAIGSSIPMYGLLGAIGLGGAGAAYTPDPNGGPAPR